MYNKSAALQNIQSCLTRIGYTEESLIRDYTVSTSGSNVLKLDLVAFSDEIIHDTTTSCIAVRWCDNENEKTKYIEEAKYIATPIMLIPEIERVEIWNVKIEQPSIIFKLKYDELYPYFQKNRFDFSSQKIVEAKYGIRQLSLFEAFGLVEFAESANYHILGDEFKKALYAGKTALDKLMIKGEKNYSALTSITMHVLGAIILNHKLFPNERIENIDVLIDKLSNKFNKYFDKDYIYKFGSETIQSIYDILDKNISYRSINNEMLGHFYESTLFEDDVEEKNKIRKQFGIYYTPKALGEDILAHIPIEFVNEEDRYVLDGSCGSGSLLISSYKRLEKLLQTNLKPSEKHDYLTDKIAGFEIDRFAKEVARLALLLYSLPHGNHWNISARDTLKISKFTKMKHPMIIIGNPPFEEIRKESQQQKALEFMIKYMEWLKPNGYMGIILPESFLENNSGRGVRKILLENFDILEIWSLPGTIFEKNNCATTVIIAQKIKRKITENYPVKIRIVTRNKGSIKKYLESKKVDFEFFFENQNLWLNDKNFTIHFSPIQQVLDKVSTCERMRNLTKHIQGIQIPLSKNYPFISKEYRDGYSKYVQNADNCFQPFLLQWNYQKHYKYVKYDNSLKEKYKGLRLRMSFREVYESPKVLIKLSSTPGEFWCISAAIDRDITYPSHSFYCVVPNNENISLEELCAVINSRVANAYIRAASVKRTHLVDTIKSLPIPNFTLKQKEDIKKLVNEIEKLKINNIDEDKVTELILEVNNIVNNAFLLGAEDIKLLDEYYKKYTGIECDKSKNTQINKNVWNYIGEVTEVELVQQYIKCNFVELNGSKNVKITGCVPGWLLRKGACFTADIFECHTNCDFLEIQNVRPLENAYMSDDELYSYFSNKILNEREVVL